MGKRVFVLLHVGMPPVKGFEGVYSTWMKADERRKQLEKIYRIKNLEIEAVYIDGEDE